MEIENNIHNLIQSLPATCKLIVVSKTQPVERIKEAYTAGHHIFGENKVQELTTKFDALPQDIEWHFIGHLQTNKVKYIAPFVHLIHSVDNLKLLQEINKRGSKLGRKINCLLQVHIAQEESKFGFSEDEIILLLRSKEIETLTSVHIVGLMGMATFTDNENQVRTEFQTLKNIFETLKQAILPNNVTMRELSMGMSGDYHIAVEQGSTMVRIGTAVFGERNYPAK